MIDIERLKLVPAKELGRSIAEGTKKSRVVAIGLAGVLALSASMLAAAQNAAPGAAAPPAAPRPGLGILDFKPAVDDLMTMLVQPRHIRL